MTNAEKENCLKEVDQAVDFEFYKTLFDPARIDIIKVLATNGKSNITEIAENLPQDRSVISRHLDLMNRYQLVTKEKSGRNMYYEINEETILNQFKETTNQLENLFNC
ncbi:ArsR/SmtB family transcription factor [Vagococcus fluvialis]|jgi:DNA-binding transcriptional ArsR family regulator|uniref:ArsR/SmtB family transcription factor n=1 Tax=Vagococcus fluvialis TaxID=2738 RepID=UPI0014329843|nr:winged helix-turn-helix domain-containing protein [Vagococcus fluvialis]MBO0436647.1 winged helix-turn-helix transcriptional regulator [Vagococcus fluvialis]MBO0443334.1 winged helix-turn-helix transcriptional regulator [Vagococcus fluvialis]MBO0479955.1 winged helix-turn-helix transcriptional regulator [Vagococcus fluvialis]MBO0485057.1 winged helix-turn-helix transcriptional regulator [Vagococcus fluvialis]MDT2747109.1 winged helix-turn-helix domain-containing protein [Vagococcus fluviali